MQSFGPAFLQAYDRERRVAKFPRIVIDREMHRGFLEGKAAGLGNHYALVIRPDLRHDDDGPVNVDIFNGYRHNDDYIAYEHARMIGDACRRNIQGNAGSVDLRSRALRKTTLARDRLE
jgi:hypothetical protein